MLEVRVTSRFKKEVKKAERQRKDMRKLLAATFFHAGIRRVITNNEADYRGFGVFQIIGYG